MGRGQGQDWAEVGVRAGSGRGQGQGQGGVRSSSVTLAMGKEKWTRGGRGPGWPVELLWLLLLLPWVSSGLRRSLATATPASAPGETAESGAPAPTVQRLAPGAPGTWAALCGVNSGHCWAGTRIRGPGHASRPPLCPPLHSAA